jgi:hypothetical protein
MLAFCECPQPAAIGAIPAFTCGEDFGQIQKIVFQRRQAVATFATVLAAGTLANWTALKAALAGTKVVITPFFENFIIPPVEAITEGGDDNTTLDGLAVVVGRSTPIVTGNFRSLPGATFEALEAYICEPDMTMFWINEFGKIIGDSHDGTDVWGIPVHEWFIGDKGAAGKNTQDKNMFRFGLRAGWSKKLKIITPVDFNARYDL